MPAVFAPVTSPTALVDMPSWVYDDMADPDVHQIDVPYGHYTHTDNVNLFRSDLTVNWHNSSIYIDGTRSSYPFAFNSTIDPSPVTNHTPWHSTGEITALTDTLTLDSGESLTLVPGEIVIVYAGVNTGDPAEPCISFRATVESVVGFVVTFTEPFGTDVPTYADEAALTAVAEPSQAYKIGPWGEVRDGYFCKGLGLDHGIQAFVGGMAHDITFKNFHLETTIPTDRATLPVAQGHNFVCRYMANVSLLNFSVYNFIAAVVHTTHSWDILIDGLTVAGESVKVIFGAGITQPGCIFSAYGGKNITYRNLDIGGLNTLLSDTEVNPINIQVENLRYVMRFRKNYTYVQTFTVLGFYATENLLTNTSFEFVESPHTGAGVAAWGLCGNNSIHFDNLTLDTSVCQDEFSFSQNQIDGTFTIDGIAYGPLVADTVTKTRTSTASTKHIYSPKGFYKKMSVRVLDAGAATQFHSGHVDSLASTLTDPAWKSATNFLRILNLQTPADFMSKNVFNCEFSGTVGGASLVAEFDYEYYPAPDDTGWSMD